MQDKEKIIKKLEARKEDYLTMLEQNLERQRLNEQQNQLLDKMIDAIQHRIDTILSDSFIIQHVDLEPEHQTIIAHILKTNDSHA